MPQVTPAETAIILQLAQESLSRAGDFVEFGCYRGDTSVELAKILRSADKSTGESAAKQLWLYDSFAGLPAATREDQSTHFTQGQLLATKRALVDRFRHANLPRPVIKKAFFDQLDSARDLPAQIAFAFLDGDLYASLRTSLHLVWPRLTPDATVITHDYHNFELPGATRAVDEFLRAHPVQNFTTRHTLAIITK